MSQLDSTPGTAKTGRHKLIGQILVDLGVELVPAALHLLRRRSLLKHPLFGLARQLCIHLVLRNRLLIDRMAHFFPRGRRTIWSCGRRSGWSLAAGSHVPLPLRLQCGRTCFRCRYRGF